MDPSYDHSYLVFPGSQAASPQIRRFSGLHLASLSLGHSFAVSWVNNRTLQVCFQYLRDHCHSLPDVLS